MDGLSHSSTLTDEPHGRFVERQHPVAETPDAPGLFLALAPMDGVTDGTYRELLTSLRDPSTHHSGISLCVSEFVRVTNQRIPPLVFYRHCPELRHEGQLRGKTKTGVPVFVQLLGGDAQPMAINAQRAAELGAPGIDLNFGCPAKTVNRHDGGATLLKDPCRIEEVTTAVRKAVPSHIPVTVKIRVGWDSPDPLPDLAKAAEAGGAAWLTVHARTRAQLYKPPVHWHALQTAVDAISIPVVANGDLQDKASLESCAAASECTAFMIGRAAMAYPKIFASLRNWQSENEALLERQDLFALLQQYTELLMTSGLSPRGSLGRLKQWLRMATAFREDLVADFDRVKVMRSLEEVSSFLNEQAVSSQV